MESQGICVDFKTSHDKRRLTAAPPRRIVGRDRQRDGVTASRPWPGHRVTLSENGKDLMELRRVHPGTLDLSLGRLRQLPERAVREKMESLRNKGQLSPLVAAKQDEVLVLVDGFVRHLAAMRLGLESVLVEVVELSTVQMKAQLYLRNRERGLLLWEECRLVRELHEVDGLSQVQIGDLLERHKSWVCRRLSLVRQLSPVLWDDVSLGHLGAGSLRRLTLLPACNQEQLVCVVQRDGLGPRDSATLIDLWRRAGDPEARQYVLEHPRDVLARARACSEEAVDVQLGPGARQVVSCLVGLAHLSLRIERRVREGLGALPPEGVELIARVRHRAAQHGGAALDAVAKWLTNQGEQA